MKALYSFLIIGVSSVLLSACCKGGSGGDASITAFPFHHTKPIPGVTVYVKYDATEFPGASPSSYDINFKAGATDLSVKCTGLTCGNYYLYGVGYDSSISQIVSGGMNVKISYSDRKNNANVNLAITE